MQVSSEEIIRVLREAGQYVSDNGLTARVDSVSTLAAQRSGSLSWVNYDTYDLSRLQCGVLIAGEAFRGDSGTILIIRTRSPRESLALLLRRFFARPEPPAGIAATASVAASARIGEEVYVGDRVSIGEDCVIGDRSRILPGAVLCAGTVVGADVVIGPGAVVGGDGFGFFRREDGSYGRMTHAGGVVLADSVEVGANTCIDAGVIEPTLVGLGTKISNLCQIAHSVRIGRDCVICGNTVVGGNTVIGDACWIGPSSTLLCDSIGEKSFVRGGSLVDQPAPAGTFAYGSPARMIPVRLVGGSIRKKLPW